MKEIDPLNFLKAVYMNADLPLSVRMRAAIAALPFEAPKLAVTALVSEQDFASLLERRLKHQAAIEANGGNNQIERAVEVRLPLPRLADRRFRRI
jgi:hypothetical protein